MLHRITKTTLLPGARLLVVYDDGAEATVELTPLLVQGGVFAELRDAARLAQVTIGPGGSSIEWPGGIDLCADALRLEAEAAGTLSASQAITASHAQ